MLQKIVDNTQDATDKVRDAAGTLDQTLQANRDAIGSLVHDWDATAGSVQRMADQINAAIAENRPGLRDFTQNNLYEHSGLAQDAQRIMVDQITRVTEDDPTGELLVDRLLGVARQADGVGGLGEPGGDPPRAGW